MYICISITLDTFLYTIGYRFKCINVHQVPMEIVKNLGKSPRFPISFEGLGELALNEKCLVIIVA